MSEFDFKPQFDIRKPDEQAKALRLQIVSLLVNSDQVRGLDLVAEAAKVEAYVLKGAAVTSA